MTRVEIQSKYAAVVEANWHENQSTVYSLSEIKFYPYQIVAARFVLCSNSIKGCILCDESSLDKTDTAILIATPKWYEVNENILVIFRMHFD